jgi:hypothetical protein
MRTPYACLSIALLALPLCAGATRADILVTVDKSAQRMTVSRDGQALYNWPVSTGKTGHATPSGKFQAFRMERDHFSKEWDDAPMPYSIFFTKVGHAIHGTNSRNLGMPVSHGCVRLSVAHAEKLYSLVQQEGVLKTKVVLTGSEQIALKRGRTQLAEREENVQPQQPQYRQGYQPYQPGYGQRYDRGYEPPRNNSQYDNSPYGNPQYANPQYSDPQYADRRATPRYGDPYYNYYDRGYRPQPQYIQPEYRDPYRDRYGIY